MRRCISIELEISPLRHLFTVILLCGFFSVVAQEKHLVQVKTFDQQLNPYRNIEVSINGRDFIAMGTRASAFIEFSASDLPVKSVAVRNNELEAASWNYSKGILEIIVRKKSYRIYKILLTDDRNTPLANHNFIYNGSRPVALSTDAKGRADLPLPLEEKINSINQFSVEGYFVSAIHPAGDNVTITATMPVVIDDKPLTKAAQKPEEYFRDFDLARLDSIQSLTVFYAVFKNIPMKNLPPAMKRRVDAKFAELMEKLKDSLRTTEVVFTGKISDSSFVGDDIKNLLAQAELESQMLDAQRSEFDRNIQLLNEKLSGGVENLDPETRDRLLQDIARLEQMLVENQNRFLKNQSDYRQVINSLKETYFDFENLENKLSISEAQRLEEQRIFRQRLFATLSISFVFAVLLILLIKFSNKLKKQKKELVRVNAEINRINENLEDLVFQRTRLLQEAHHELDTFLYRASHDLRSPVCTIVGLCNLASHFSSEEARNILDKVVYTTSSMDRLLKKLTIISEINQPTNFSAVNLSEIISNVAAEFKREIESGKIRFTIECPDDLIIYSYPNLVEAVFANLLENAFFYATMKPNSSPTVEFRAKARGDLLEFSVYDNGIGIDPKIRDKIFNMFFKGNISSKGNGLGLYIVQKCVQALDGDVTLETEPGSFTRLMVHLPMKTRQATLEIGEVAPQLPERLALAELEK